MKTSAEARDDLSALGYRLDTTATIGPVKRGTRVEVWRKYDDESLDRPNTVSIAVLLVTGKMDWTICTETESSRERAAATMPPADIRTDGPERYPFEPTHVLSTNPEIPGIPVRLGSDGMLYTDADWRDGGSPKYGASNAGTVLDLLDRCAEVPGAKLYPVRRVQGSTRGSPFLPTKHTGG